MKKAMIFLLVPVLCAGLLCGCALAGVKDALSLFPEDMGDYVAYSDMVYTRPDMEQLEYILNVAVTSAAGTNVDHIIQMVYDFYDVYDAFYTNYSLADIRYSADLTDAYWEAESNFCMENSPRVDAALEELYYALAKSPCLAQLESEEYFGPGYFDAYQGENNWDAEFTALLEAESALITRYYELASIGAEFDPGSESYYAACGDDMAQLLVDLILIRRDIAAYWGYDSYAGFATDFYYYRDYPLDLSRQYLEDIRRELVDLYRRMNASGIWEDGFTPATEEETYAYVREMAQNMGGTICDAFTMMDKAGLYDIAYSPNKYPSSFELYLTSYYEPFIFMCPSLTNYDHLTFAHEFGHFCNDYASWGSLAGVDVMEIFSQGMEYLSLFYVDGARSLETMKMADSLSLYVEQAAYASFEMQMYALPEEELTPEALIALYDRVALAYGFDSVGYDSREFVTINHYFTNPMYILSYVVSNDAALQLYQLEQENPGSGLACLAENLATGETYFLSFLESANLQSPFTPGRLESVRATFEVFFP